MRKISEIYINVREVYIDLVFNATFFRFYEALSFLKDSPRLLEGVTVQKMVVDGSFGKFRVRRDN